MKDNCPWYVQLPITQPPRYITYPGVMQNTYVITDFGQIFNVVKGFEVSQSIGTNGYYTSSLLRENGTYYPYSIHRLVGWEWVLENRDFNLHINHIDGNKLNNNYWNLEWVTPAENIHHAYRTGLMPAHLNQGETHGAHILTDEDEHMICQMLQDPKVTYDEVLKALDYKITFGTLGNIIYNNAWTHIRSQYNIPKRRRSGESSSSNILTDSDVHMICQMLQDPKVTYDEVLKALDYKVSRYAVQDIVSGRTWDYIRNQYSIPFREIERPSGILNNKAKITEEDAHKICQMLEDPKTTYRKILETIGKDITFSVVFNIAKGRTWKNISSQYNIPERDWDHGKLTEEEVHKICQMLEDPNNKCKDIAMALNNKVTVDIIRCIARGKIWKGISSCYDFSARKKRKNT